MTSKRAAAVFGIQEELAGSPVGGFRVEDLVSLGRKKGYFRKPAQPMCISVFVTKGGVLKTSLTLNLARTAALHGLKVCVVGLDMQADITTILVDDLNLESQDDLRAALAQASELKGLSDVFSGESKLKDVILESEIPNLHVIPETPELVALDQSLMSRNRREYWLKENVVDPLKSEYDLIVLDCSPNWNRLITNALVACDVLLSPVECRVTNFRNLKIFRALVADFRKEMRLSFAHWYVATRLSRQRRLSTEIYQWYQANLNSKLETLLDTPIRESLAGEEATAMRISVPEYQPFSSAAEEMRQLLKDLQGKLRKLASEKTLKDEVVHVSRTR